MNKYYEEDLGKILTPEEAEAALRADGGETMGDQVEDVLEDNASVPFYLQYDDEDDPELIQESYKRLSRQGHRMNLREAASWIQDELYDYWDANGFDDSEEAFKDFKDNYYETPEGKKPMNDTILHQRWAANAAKYGLKSGGSSSRVPAEPKEPVDPYEGLSDETLKFIQMLTDFQENDLSAEASAQQKYDLLANTAANIIMGKSFKKHAFICGDAGVGKTYAIRQICKQLWDKSPLKKQGYTLTYNKGDIGQSIVPITAFFFEHRDKEIIILDDADAFLAKNDDRVLNMLKGMLNSENTVDNPEPVFIPSSIRLTTPTYLKNKEKSTLMSDTETRYLNGEFMREANVMKINAKKFHEGIMELSCNGNIIYSGRMTEEERNKYHLVTKDEMRRQRESKNLLGMGYTKRFNEEVYDANDMDIAAGREDQFYRDDGTYDYDAAEGFGENWGGSSDGDGEANWNPEFGGGRNEDGKWSLPEQFIFTSRLIMISNLAPDQVNEAFKSRCEVVAITLTHEEFVAHLAVVVPGMMHGLETSIDPELIDKIKNENYAFLKRAMEMEGRNFGGINVKVNLPLQFRLVPELCSKWLGLAEAYCRNNADKVGGELSLDNFDQVAKALEANFFLHRVIPFLANNEYSGDPNKRRKH